jgi:hypothetical protein
MDELARGIFYLLVHTCKNDHSIGDSLSIKTTARIYEMGRGAADNVKVIDKLTLVVHNIDDRTNRVLIIANPNIVEYRETAKSQRIGFESIDETRSVWMTTNDKPIEVKAGGTAYQISVDSIATEENERRWPYCDLVISW